MIKVSSTKDGYQHLPRVIELWRNNKKTLGFFPEGAFEEYAQKGTILLALSSKSYCVGYLLYRKSGRKIKIVHLCMDKAWRGKGIGKKLVDHLKMYTNNFLGIGLRCRRDFEAAKVWPKMGFVAQSNRLGRSRLGKILTDWWFDHGHPDLFTTSIKRREQTEINVVIDANIFFDLGDKSKKKNYESLSLTEDWLRGEINLCLTEEIYNEIERQNDSQKKLKWRGMIAKYNVLVCDDSRYFEEVLASLRPLFKEKLTPSDESDLRQLARTIVSGSRFFITRDVELLKLAEEVYEKYEVSIMRPSQLISHIDESLREIQYRPASLAGTHLKKILVSSEQVGMVSKYFLLNKKGEDEKSFKKKVRRFLSFPNQFECVLISDVNELPLAFVVYDKREKTSLKIPLMRINHSGNAPTLARHIVQNSILKSVKEDRIFTIMSDSNLEYIVVDALHEFFFVPCHNGWIKLNIGIVRSAQEVGEYLQEKMSNFPAYRSPYFNLLTLLNKMDCNENVPAMAEIENWLWPIKISDAPIPSFIIPIKPIWAQHLFDEDLASQTLFGAKEELALACESVYYRSHRNTGRISAPARILWYVTKSDQFHNSGRIRACSKLEEVLVGDPKELYQQFRRLGVYKWREIERLTNNGKSEKIMALKFRFTEKLLNPIKWDDMQKMLMNGKIKSKIQSPTRIPNELFISLYLMGNKVITDG